MNWKQPKHRYLPDVAKPEQEEIDRHNAEIQKPLDKLEKDLAGLRQPYHDMLLDKKLESLPEEVDAALGKNEQHKAEKEGIERRMAALEGYKRSYGKIQALWDVGPPPVTRLLQRGAVESPGPKVKPGFLEVLSPPGGNRCGSAWRKPVAIVSRWLNG